MKKKNIIKPPKGKSDFSEGWLKYYFYEKKLQTGQGPCYKIKLINNTLYYWKSGFDKWYRCSEKANKAYKEWQFNKKIRDLLND